MAIVYEFIHEKSIENDRKEKLSKTFELIKRNITSLQMCRKNSDYSEKKDKLEGKIIELVNEDPELIFIVEHYFPDNVYAGNEKYVTLYETLLENNYMDAAKICLRNEEFRNTKMCARYSQYPAMRLVWCKEGAEIISNLLTIDKRIYTQQNDDGENIGMCCAGPGRKDFYDVINKCLDHRRASIMQDKYGRTIAMHCALWRNKECLIKAVKDKRMKAIKDKAGSTLYDYLYLYQIELPKEYMPELKPKNSKR